MRTGGRASVRHTSCAAIGPLPRPGCRTNGRLWTWSITGCISDSFVEDKSSGKTRYVEAANAPSQSDMRPQPRIRQGCHDRAVRRRHYRRWPRRHITRHRAGRPPARAIGRGAGTIRLRAGPHRRDAAARGAHPARPTRRVGSIPRTRPRPVARHGVRVGPGRARREPFHLQSVREWLASRPASASTRCWRRPPPKRA